MASLARRSASTPKQPIPDPKRSVARAAIALAALVVSPLLVTGCSLSEAPEFQLNLEGRDPKKVSLAQREALQEAMTGLFGTPNEPRVPQGSSLDLDLLKAAAGPVGSDAQGIHRGLYRQHCASCHGISGDGAGPSASLLNPYPRDYRRGVFKYTSTLPGIKPTKDDLELTLLRGIPGTAMPSFARLPPEEITALVEYVKYLSIRGETERYLIQLVVDEDEYLPLNMDEVIEDGLMPAVEAWNEPEQNPKLLVVPPPPPPMSTPAERLASIARGKELYALKDAQCVKCHGPGGRGDGEQSADIYDDWNKPKQGVSPAQTAALAGLFTLPLQQLRPRDFGKGVFRGGSRPEDLYLRIYIGIKGTPMPGVGEAPGVKGVLEPKEIWDVVNYVRSLSGGR
jgi:mono/diheme cytochrome c family protein